MKMWCFLAILLVLGGAEAEPDSTTLLTMDRICKQTDDYRFCNQTFIKNLRTPTPSTKDLMNITIQQAYGYSSSTYFFIGQLLRNAGPGERNGLQMCADAYITVNMSFSDAETELTQEEYDKIGQSLDHAGKAFRQCKTDYRVLPYRANPLIERNREMSTLIAMAKIVRCMLS